MLLVSGTVAWNASANSDSCNNVCDTECNESLSCPDTRGCVLGTKTHFSMRPAHSNLARTMTADADKIHRFGEECFNGMLSVGLQYQQTRKPGKLASYFFGKSTLTYGNTCDGQFDIYGQNLGTVESGKITFAPRIRSFIADFEMWFGLDELVCGLWTRIGVPVNHTNWNLRPCVTPDTPTSTTPSFFPEGQVDFLTAGTTASFASVLGGLQGLPFGAAPAAHCGKVCSTKTTNVSGLVFELGYDFLRTECGHFGAALRFVAPTGTRPDDNFLFHATTGSQHSWELGATITSSYLAWEGCGGDQRLGLFFDANVTHLFYAKQRRLFDLKRRDGTTNPMSYWMLLKKFDSAGAVVGLERAANVLCCDVKVGAKVMADLALMVQYDCGCFSAAVGWNFWIRSQERLKSTDCSKNKDCNTTTTRRTCTIEPNTYGIKGSAPVQAVGTDVTDTTTYSNATIGNCGAADESTVFLRTSDIDFCSALHPRAFSNKVFGWVGYNWRDCEWQPYVAVEGEVEFGHDNKAVDQWGVMLKGGVAF